MRTAIGFVIRNLPIVLFGLAFVATVLSRRGSFPERLLGWILLLPIGVSGLWAAFFHIFLPVTAAAHIGWKVSPFQFEVGVADLAVGATACLAFWRGLEFKAAAIMVSSIALLGDAAGHVRQMLVAHNFASGNAGVPFYMDIACPLLAILLLSILRRTSARGPGAASAYKEIGSFPTPSVREHASRSFSSKTCSATA